MGAGDLNIYKIKKEKKTLILTPYLVLFIPDLRFCACSRAATTAWTLVGSLIESEALEAGVESSTDTTEEISGILIRRNPQIHLNKVCN